MLNHEEAARRVHPGAYGFETVTGLWGKLLGWTFKVPRESRPEGPAGMLVSDRHSWMTADHETTSDTFVGRWDASKSLKDYLRVKGQIPKNSQEGAK